MDGRFQLLRWDVGISHYLEPLLFPKAWADPKTALSSTLAHELALATRGQYGFDFRLIPQTTWQLGGLYTIRGYRQNEASGDTVYMGTAEYRFHLPHSLPIRREPLQLPVFGDFRMTPQQAYGRTDWDLILSGFIDAGRAIRNRYDEGAGERNNTLIGAGAGVELRIRQNIRARFDWARALKTTYFANGLVSTPKGSDEFHFLVSVLY